MTPPDEKSIALLLVAEDNDRTDLLVGQLSMILPRASIAPTDISVIAEEALPNADAIVLDAGPIARGTADLLRVLRARGFSGPIVVITPVPDDSTLRSAMESLGTVRVARSIADSSPSELAAALTAAFGADAKVAAELRQARRIFAAGQAALSLQHAINNPLAALMAEAQLLQMEELNGEQRGSVDRIVELCRRLVALVRRLDALADG